MSKFGKFLFILFVIIVWLGVMAWFAMQTEQGREKLTPIKDKITAVFSGENGITENIENQVKDHVGVVDYDLDQAMNFSRDYEILEGTVTKTCLGSEITDLEVEVSGCNFRVVSSDDESFYAEGKNVGKYQAYVEAGKLILRSTTTSQNWDKESNTEIVLSVPEGRYLNSVSFALGAGTMDCANMRAETMNLEVSAGSLTGENLTATLLTLDAGMGKLKLSNIAAGALSAEVGMGEISVNGYVAGDSYAKASMGTITFLLTGNPLDYNYVMKAGAGAVTIGEEVLNGATSGKVVDHNAEHTITAECALGKIKITFLAE